MLLRARRREADPTYMCGIAAEIFNRSPHMRTVLGLIEEHGPPTIRLGVEGLHTAARHPRHVRVVGRVVLRAAFLTYARSGWPVSCSTSRTSRAAPACRRRCRIRPNARLDDGPVSSFTRSARHRVAGAHVWARRTALHQQEPGHEAADVREVCDAERDVRVHEAGRAVEHLQPEPGRRAPAPPAARVDETSSGMAVSTRARGYRAT